MEAAVQHSKATSGSSSGSMQSAARLAVSAFLISSVLAYNYQTSTKLRRDGVLNLYPFPRVGRASSQTWQIPIEDLILDYKPEQKRQLYAFPRVGRSDVSHLLPQLSTQEFSPQMHSSPEYHNLMSILMKGMNRYKKSEMADKSKMWFGPRLGRPSKSSYEDDIVIPTQNTDRSEPEQVEQQLIEDRKKRQIKQN